MVRWMVMRKIMAIITLAAFLLSASAPALAEDIHYKASNDPGTDRYISQYKTAVANNALAMNRKAQDGGIGFGRSMERQIYNQKYWDEVILEGRQYWKVKSGVDESKAVRDVFDPNGGYYKIDCAAAINLIVLKSKLDVVGNDKFNKHYFNMILKGWDIYTQPDGKDWKDEKSIEHQEGSEYEPGDTHNLEVGDYVYYKNPNPMTRGRAEQGENALYMGKDEDGIPTFWGLNMGIFKGRVCKYGFLTSVRGRIDADALKKLAES